MTGYRGPGCGACEQESVGAPTMYVCAMLRLDAKRGSSEELASD